ncbi:MAG: hypothetical protein IAE82_15995 [Opitutaceae bacterium]|nr:hypothetical protein [Opitutaceae bacterium]
MNTPLPPRRNPGPSGGYRLLRALDRVLPEAIFRPLRAAGTLVAMAGMAEQRRHSYDYLTVALARRPTWRDVFRHFFAFEEVLMTRLRVINGQPHQSVFAPGSEDLRAWLESGTPALLGTFHVGVTELQGCQIAMKLHHPMHVVRLRVGNSHDTEKLEELFGDRLHFIWINEPAEMLLALKDAAATHGSIALQCDRPGYSARSEAFEFLGARRVFPFTIYHLAQIFQRPVLFAVGVPDGPDRARLHAIPRYEPRPGEPRAEALARARVHFQGFLQMVEEILREHPYLWFNFTPLNPVAPDSP